MSKSIDVLVTCKLLPVIEAKLSARYRVHRADAGQVPPDVAANVRALMTDGTASSALLDQLPKLEIITCVSVGYDGVDVKRCIERAIPITNTPNVLNDDVADLAIALMVMTSRRLAVADKYVRDGKWLKAKMPFAHKASGKKLGIVGLGQLAAISHGEPKRWTWPSLIPIANP